jgi:hypothetical protein
MSNYYLGAVSGWQQVAEAPGGAVLYLACSVLGSDDKIYIRGSDGHVYQWDGINLVDVGKPGSLGVRSVAWHSGELYAINLGTGATVEIFKWDGEGTATWTSCGKPGGTSDGRDIVTVGSDLYCGQGSSAYKYSAPASWSSVGTPRGIGALQWMANFDYGSGEKLWGFNYYALPVTGWVHAYEYSSGTTWVDKGQVGVPGDPNYINGWAVMNQKIYVSVIIHATEASPEVYSSDGSSTWTATSFPGGSNRDRWVSTIDDNEMYQLDKAGPDDLWKYTESVGWSSAAKLKYQPYYRYKGRLLATTAAGSGILVTY